MECYLANTAFPLSLDKAMAAVVDNHIWVNGAIDSKGQYELCFRCLESQDVPSTRVYKLFQPHKSA